MKMSTKVAESLAKDVGVNSARFLELADKVIGFANHSALEMRKDAVHLAFLYAIARYGVFVWQNSPKNEDPEAFIAKMLKHYEAMLREQLGDTKLENRPASF
jgi:hypothetical protein